MLFLIVYPHSLESQMFKDLSIIRYHTGLYLSIIRITVIFISIIAIIIVFIAVAFWTQAAKAELLVAVGTNDIRAALTIVC